MKELGVLAWVAVVLVIVGGLNYGLVGFFDYNLIEAVFGKVSVVTRIVYAFIGVAAIWMIYFMSRCCPKGGGKE